MRELYAVADDGVVDVGYYRLGEGLGVAIGIFGYAKLLLAVAQNELYYCAFLIIYSVVLLEEW